MMMGSEGEHADDDSMCDMTMYADVLWCIEAADCGTYYMKTC